jgi:hypothetical protein
MEEIKQEQAMENKEGAIADYHVQKNYVPETLVNKYVIN